MPAVCNCPAKTYPMPLKPYGGSNPNPSPFAVLLSPEAGARFSVISLTSTSNAGRIVATAQEHTTANRCCAVPGLLESRHLEGCCSSAVARSPLQSTALPLGRLPKCLPVFQAHSRSAKHVKRVAGYEKLRAEPQRQPQ
ncbi:hypothetical protein Anapl_00881 [Anas platyrhynchos]|uniref:Uncharacterized protein n=1 Tax=Anas platyrhynchos TaxID=8839 RepID=R0LR02_ANAPL|nr:hypothetical protein Anapl_00881 [Anas platyrhynchos]